MPNIKFSGVKKEWVEEYSKKLDEVAKLVVAKPENIMFIATDDVIYPQKGKQTPIYITVEWMQRLDKEKLLANHLTDFFSKYSDKVGVFFTDINGKWYVNGNQIK